MITGPITMPHLAPAGIAKMVQDLAFCGLVVPMLSITLAKGEARDCRV
jgi:hypothetical protein